MINFRMVFGNVEVMSDLNKLPPLDQWFERVIDIPFDEFEIEDLCRSIRQKLCINYLLPRALHVLKEDPMAGEMYDGELIAAISTLKKEDITSQIDIFKRIKNEISQIDLTNVDEEIKRDIFKINQIDV